MKTCSHTARGAPRGQALINDSTQSPKGQSEDRIPDEESDDFRAKDQPSGVIDAQCGRRSSTGFRNLRPWGPHITRGLSRVSPELRRKKGKRDEVFLLDTVLNPRACFLKSNEDSSITVLRKRQWKLQL